MKTTPLLATLAFASSLTAGTPVASTASVPAAHDGWEFRFVPYAWLSSIEGDVGIGPLSAPIDLGIDDVLSQLDMTYMGVIEASKGPWALVLDFAYAKTSQDSNGAIISRYEQKQWLITPAIACRVFENESSSFDLLAGARGTILQADLTLRHRDGGQTTRGKDGGWADPILGFRGNIAITDTLSLGYGGDIGGFGVDSDLVWEAHAFLGYAFSQQWTALFGYRGMGLDRQEGEFRLESTTHGPFLGLGCAW